MSDKLLDLKKIAIKLYFRYRSDLLSLEEYLSLVKPIDDAIDKLEMQPLINYLQDTPVCEISSLKQLH